MPGSLNVKPIRALRLFCLAVGFGWSVCAWSADSNLGETNEIKFSSAVAVDLAAKAANLSSPVAIYEYVRNNYDFALYHGARSGSANTFLGGRGNDVDLAATLIAMLRYRGIPARYVVGTVRLPAAQAMNWLAVENIDLAYGILRDQGIQNVALAADKSTLDLEHTWVEVLVPYDEYRGAGPATVNCATTPAFCTWVPLDPSFKQHQQRASGLDPYSALSFDYTAYYNALKNNDPARRDKNPLEIYEEQVLAYLQSTAPGKTLEDVPDFTGIVPVEDGLLPASLPYTTIGSLRRYNSAADHDAAVALGTEKKNWTKYVTATAIIGGLVNKVAKVSLVDAATSRFTMTFTRDANNNLAQVFRLDGAQVGGSIVAGTIIINGTVIDLGYPFTLSVTMDGAPAPDTNGSDKTISANYNAIIGGYYLIATGGEPSNWSQAHRAAQQLLTANQQYKIVLNPADPGQNGQPCDVASGLNCTPYVDVNLNGWDATDLKLLESSSALDALTGGLLYVAASQYYATLQDDIARADSLNKIKTPIVGFLGVVSSTHDVEYIDGTAFSVLPGGLLIDMKGITVGGNWRIDQPAEYSNKQFEFIGHIVSSLEHETWQQLTGYDAISTVRGIQMALNNGATLVNPQKNNSTDTVAAMYPSFGYGGSAPAGFTRNVRNIFGQNYLSWSYGGTDPNASFVTFRPNVQGLSTSDPLLTRYTYAASSGLDGFYSNYDSLENSLLALQATQGQLKTVTLGSSLSNYQTQDVLSASVASPAGFAVASYTRTGAGTYNFVINETGSHADGTYPISVSVQLGDVSNVATYTVGGLTNYRVLTATATSPGGFVVNSFSTATTDPHTFTLGETAAHTDGSYAVNVALQLFFNSNIYTGNITLGVNVASGRWVDASGPIGIGSIDTSDNVTFSCAGGADGAVVSYTGTPSVLLGNLQGCFNNVLQLNGWTGLPSFFDPNASLVFRSVPAAIDAQLSSNVTGFRDDLYLRDYNVNSVEYLIPSKLSVGPTYRFSVDLAKNYQTASGKLSTATFSIQNDSGVAASGGFVRPITPFAIRQAPSEKAGKTARKATRKTEE